MTIQGNFGRLGVAGVGFGLTQRLVTIVTANLDAEWRFDDGSGQVLTDYSGNGRHGELGSTSGVDAQDPAWAASPARLDFDGTDDYVNLTQHSVFLANSLTYAVCAVVRASAAGDVVFYGEGVSTDVIPALLLYRTAGNLAWLFTDFDGSPSQFWDTGLALDDQDHFMAISRDGVNLIAMVDGVEATISRGTSGIGLTGFDQASIGAALRETVIDSPWGDRIYWMARYTGALTSAQIQQNRAYAKARMQNRGVTLP